MTTSNATTADSETILRALRRTRQIRDFRPDPIPDDVLEKVLDVARWTGSAMNRQPWTFVVIRDRDRRAKLVELAPQAGHVAKAAAVIAIVMPGDSADQDSYDEGRVSERILVAATALGLGAGIGWVRQANWRGVAELLGIPSPQFVRTFISLGYPTEAAAAPKNKPGAARKPLSELVRYERFG
ncbi:MAG TPA: nitroreductase family protein [Candidatus Limnocylindrales bacterium]|jgi:nitroreductase